MKRTILSALAVSMLAATSFGAQAAPLFPQVSGQGQVQLVDWKPGKTVVKRKVVRNKHGVVTKRVVTKRWVRGHRVPDWRRKASIRDYNRYGLYRPARGQHWVRVDNDYLLIAAATGVIVGVMAGR